MAKCCWFCGTKPPENYKKRRRRRGEKTEGVALRKAVFQHEPMRFTQDQNKFYPHEFVDANDDRKEAYFDFKRHAVAWNRNTYTIGKKVGQGHFGDVFLATGPSGDVYVVKTLKVAHKEQLKLRQEVRLLELVRGGPNICTLVDTVLFETGEFAGKKGLVFEKVDYVTYKKLYPELSATKRRLYLYQLLIAIDYTHSLGIIHRDIKPSNILIDPKNDTVQLIDWGVGGFYRQDTKGSRGPGTRCYMAPELCVGYDWYDYSVDMWAFGCVVGAMIFLATPMMRGKGSWLNQLIAITDVVGTRAMFEYLMKLGVTLDDTSTGLLEGFEQKSWESWVDEDNESLVCDESMDLISKVIVCDHTARLTARECMYHPYFDDVREKDRGAKERRPTPRQSSPLLKDRGSDYESDDYYYSYNSGNSSEG